jgi:hypothetical protein
MKFRELLNRTTIRYIVITILLGAIGSGLWEWLLKPSLMELSQFGLSVATLGVKAFKDSLYQEIAQGLHEEPSLRMYVVVFSMLPIVVLGFVAGFTSARRSARQGVAPSAFQSAVLRMGPVFVVSAYALLLISIIQANQLAYVNRAIAHFNQLLTITAPYVSEDARLAYKAQFAQVASAEDYGAVVAKLDDVCRAKALRCPTFSVW